MTLPHFVEAFLSRSDWGASPLVPTAGYPLALDAPVGAVLHHTVMPRLRGESVEAYMRRLQRARPDLGNEVPYTFLLFAGATDSTCVIAEGRGMGRTGAHTAGLNSSRIAIAVAGNTDADAPMTAGMVAGFRWVCATQLANPDGAVPTIGHQQAPPYFQGGTNLNATACPGHDGMGNLPNLQPPFTASFTQQEDDDMFTDDDRALLQATAKRSENVEWNLLGATPAEVRTGNLVGEIVGRNVAWLVPVLVAEIVARIPGAEVDVAKIAAEVEDVVAQNLRDRLED
jgi:hypothetical protein